MNDILWIEDDQKLLDATVPVLEKRGLFIQGANSGEDGIREFRDGFLKYSLILVDLDMPGMNGVETIKQIRKLNSAIPIIIVSAHLGEPKWRLQLNTIDEELLEIEKPFPMSTSEDFTPIMDRIKNKQNEYRTQLKDPFKYTLDEFIELTEEQRDAAFNAAFIINGVFIESYFNENPAVDWVVIAKEPQHVIAKGRMKDEPFEDDLTELAKNVDAPVFIYSRPKIIEQIDTYWVCPQGKSTDVDDYYPTVMLQFLQSSTSPLIKGDFDTGSVYSYVSYEHLLKHDIIKQSIWKGITSGGEEKLWGRIYKYIHHKLHCNLVGKDDKKQKIVLNCHAVREWEKAPQVMNYKNRVALIGRNILLDNKIKLVLDGENRETDIIRGEQ